MSNAPRASIWLEVPGDCHMEGSFTGDRDIQVTFGHFGSQQNLLFEREVLERFVKLAGELLAVPMPDDPKAELPVAVA
jgi:hypothetical protein